MRRQYWGEGGFGRFEQVISHCADTHASHMSHNSHSQYRKDRRVDLRCSFQPHILFVCHRKHHLTCWCMLLGCNGGCLGAVRGSMLLCIVKSWTIGSATHLSYPDAASAPTPAGLEAVLRLDLTSQGSCGCGIGEATRPQCSQRSPLDTLQHANCTHTHTTTCPSSDFRF